MQGLRTGAFAEQVVVDASQAVVDPCRDPARQRSPARLRGDHGLRSRRQHGAGRAGQQRRRDRHRRRRAQRRPGRRVRRRDDRSSRSTLRTQSSRRHEHSVQPTRSIPTARTSSRPSPLSPEVAEPTTSSSPSARSAPSSRVRCSCVAAGTMVIVGMPASGVTASIDPGHDRQRRAANSRQQDGLGADRGRRPQPRRALPGWPTEARRADLRALPARARSTRRSHSTSSGTTIRNMIVF